MLPAISYNSAWNEWRSNLLLASETFKELNLNPIDNSQKIAGIAIIGVNLAILVVALIISRFA
jgi:hypothetical protein